MNDFELLYYCMLQDDFAHAFYYARYNRYLLGIIHHCVKDNHEAQMVYETIGMVVSSLLASYQPIRCKHFKSWFALCAKRSVVRCVNTLRHRYRLTASLDAPVLSEAMGYPTSLMADRNDPQYMDELRMKMDIVKHTVDDELSEVQRKALSHSIYGDKAALMAKPQLKNGLHHAKSKIHANLKRHR